MTRSPGNRNYMRFERTRPPEPTQPFSFFTPTPTPAASGAASFFSPTSAVAGAAVARGSTLVAAANNASTPSNNFRRELTQEERVKKESSERQRVQAQHLAERLGHADHVAETARLQNEHARLMHEQAEERSRYDAEQNDKDKLSLISEAAAAGKATSASSSSLSAASSVTGVAPAASATSSKLKQIVDGKKALLVDEEDDADEENEDATEQTTTGSQQGDGTMRVPSVISSAMSAATLAADAAVQRKKLTRSDSANLDAFFHQHEQPHEATATAVVEAAPHPAALLSSSSSSSHLHHHPPPPHPAVQFAPNIGQGVIGPRHIVQSVSQPALSHLLQVSTGSSSVEGSSVPLPPPTSSPTTKKMPRLQKECLKLKQEGVTHLLLLITDAEFKEMG